MIWTVTTTTMKRVEFTREDGYGCVVPKNKFPDAKVGDQYEYIPQEDKFVLITKTFIEIEL